MAYSKNTWASGDVVTSAKLNNMENGIEAANSGSLPAVTSDDNGDVLTVVEGAWAKATPAGAGAPYFQVTAVVSQDYTTISLEEDYNTIKQAITDGKIVFFVTTEEHEEDGDIASLTYIITTARDAQEGEEPSPNQVEALLVTASGDINFYETDGVLTHSFI